MSATVPYPPSTGTPYFAGPTDTADQRAEQTLFGLAVAAGIVGIGLGAAMLIWPDTTLTIAAALFGAWLLVHGAVRIVQAIAGFGAETGARVLAGVVGVLFVVAGVVCLRNLLTSLAVVVTLIGVAWLVAGLVELAAAFVSRGTLGHRLWSMVLPGAVSVIGGIAVLVWPGMSLAVMVYVVGAWLIVLGAIQLFIVFRARHALAG